MKAFATLAALVAVLCLAPQAQAQERPQDDETALTSGNVQGGGNGGGVLFRRARVQNNFFFNGGGGVGVGFGGGFHAGFRRTFFVSAPVVGVSPFNAFFVPAPAVGFGGTFGYGGFNSFGAGFATGCH